MQPTIKIFVTYKEKHPLLKSEIFTPIQTGRAIAEETFEDMIGDNTGDNISSENPKYNELSAQYWVWKNYNKIGNPDYVGFTHFKRHFIFDEPENLSDHKIFPPKSNFYCFNLLDKQYKNMMNDDDIKFITKKYDCITLKPYDVRNLGDNSIRERFSKLPQQKPENYDIFIKTLYEEAPQYKDEIDFLHENGIQYLCNMFIMKKELFFEYSQFAFNILQKVDAQINSTHYSEKGLRYLGFFGEMLLGIFVTNLKKRSNKIKVLDGSRTLCNDIVEELKPAFPNNKSVITTYVDDKNVSYLSVWLNSLIVHTNNAKNYDIVIIEKNISDEHKKSLLSLCQDKNNISLRFFNTKQYFANEPEDVKAIKGRCYKIYASEILKNFSKVIYVDWQCLFQDDIAKLEQINLKDKVIGACLDFNMNGFFGANHNDWIKYCSEILQMNDIYGYINSSVLVIDVKKFNEQNIAEKCFDMLMNLPIRNSEQDVLNATLQGDILYLPETWNVPTLLQLGKVNTFYTMEFNLQNKYNAALKHPSIILYLEAPKYWFCHDLPKAGIWWQYARQTPFYESLITLLIDFRISQRLPKLYGDAPQLRQELLKVHFPNINSHFDRDERQTKLLFVIEHLGRFEAKKAYYKIKKAFAFGERHKKYQQKYDAIRELIKEAKSFKKQLLNV